MRKEQGLQVIVTGAKIEFASDLILWTPKHGKAAKVRRPSKTYIKQLTEDADCQLEDLPRAMEDLRFNGNRSDIKCNPYKGGPSSGVFMIMDVI